MATLYRRYRPQNFSEVIGQNHIKITLQNEIERDEIGHAYLFCGPRGLGKTTLARLMAKAINCQNRKKGESEPCNKCDSCLSIMAGRNVDIVEIDAASHTGVDNVRENIIENARFTPNGSQYKVFIIDEVHMLSTSSFNALLKTLEEPPDHAIFILATTEVHKIPQTIISRCQRFDLKKISAEELLSRLQHIVKKENKQVEEEVLKNIVVHSEGCARDAESLLGKILTLGDKITIEQAELVLPSSDFQSIIKFMNFLAEKNSTGAIELINELVVGGVDLQIFVADLIEFLRKILLIKVNGELGGFGVELDESSAQAASDLANKFHYDQLVKMIELFVAKQNEIKRAVIIQLPMELAIIEITQEVKKDEDNDGDGRSATGEGRVVRTKAKIKNGLSHLRVVNNKKSAVIKVKADQEPAEKQVKVNMVARADKLTESSFARPVRKTHSSEEKGKWPAKGRISRILSQREFSNGVDFKKVEKSWGQIIAEILKKNYTLASLLKMSRPLKFKKEKLEIGVRNVFYKGRIDDYKNKKLVEKVISDILKAKVKIKSVVKDDFEPIDLDQKTEDMVVDNSEPIKIKKPDKPVKVEKPKDVVQDVVSMF